MSTNQIQQSSSNSAQPPLDPIAQLVAKYESNGQQPPAATQPPPQPPQKKKNTRTGFADKTLWDWLNLSAVLLVPLMIGMFTIATTIQQNQISQRQHDSDQIIAKANRDKDIQIAADQQQAATLKSYLDDMTDLMLNRGLRQSKLGDEVREIARAKTLTALRGLNGERKGILLQFLHDAYLVGIAAEKLQAPPIIDLSDADLSGADLHDAILNGIVLAGVNLAGANLHGANLSGFGYGADLSRSDLSHADLSDADLVEANLRNAKVTKEQLAKAMSLGAATLPDGSTYPSQSYPIPNHKESPGT